tara:strand:+ start:206 stop:1291 length:1086 start_codon:yes stop_codon:yes gene_type:complete
MEIYEIDCLVLGGGVAGLSIARELSNIFGSIYLLEKHGALGQETSSRNSEVIHAGIYYPKNSLKARFCVEGKQKLYSYLSEKGISHQKCGKFILSNNDAETEKLHSIMKKAEDNGVDDLVLGNKPISNSKFLNFEEYIYSPSSGIFDSHAYMLSLSLDFQNQGGQILLGNKCVSIEENSKGFILEVYDLNNKIHFKVRTRNLINAGGLESLKIFSNIVKKSEYQLELIKGEYYVYKGMDRLDNLIYPLPNEHSLGIHATIDLGKGIRFGPSAYVVSEIDYSLETDRKRDFYSSICKYWPSIKETDLVEGYTGIRAKIKGEDDFIVRRDVFGDNVFVSVLGYVSPGLTSSLALGNYVKNLIY